jgi:cytochrome c-type biogenesis protein CcmF
VARASSGTQTGKNLVASTLLLTRRNTRRYGGYLIHFGIVVMFIGLAGSAFNQSKEAEMSFGDSMQLNGYNVVCQSYSQDSNANYDSEFALLDVFHNGKKITRLAPERRVYFANTDHAQPSTIVAIHSTLASDLYVVFEGTNPANDKPIIKVFINPLVNWIWGGIVIVIFGTLVALVPPLKTATRRVEVPSPLTAVPLTPDAALGGFARSTVPIAPEGPHV